MIIIGEPTCARPTASWCVYNKKETDMTLAISQKHSVPRGNRQALVLSNGPMERE